MGRLRRRHGSGEMTERRPTTICKGRKDRINDGGGGRDDNGGSGDNNDRNDAMMKR